MAKIQGVAKKYDGSTIDYVQVFNWKTGRCVGVAMTDATGNWSTNLYGAIDVGLTYVADGCEPLTHGAYKFDFPFDLNWSKVILLLHLDGNVVDSTGLCTFSRVGVTNYSAGIFSGAIELLPTSSASINGLREAATGKMELSLGAGDFTIELFVKPYSSPTQSDQALISLFSDRSSAGWQLLLSNLKPSFYISNLSYDPSIKSPTALAVDTWHHIACCRLSGVTTIYVNGSSVASAPDSNSYSALSRNLSIGYQGEEQGSARYPFKGMIDEVRITKGLARYTSNFTPPTEPHPHAHS